MMYGIRQCFVHLSQTFLNMQSKILGLILMKRLIGIVLHYLNKYLHYCIIYIYHIKIFVPATLMFWFVHYNYYYVKSIYSHTSHFVKCSIVGSLLQIIAPLSGHSKHDISTSEIFHWYGRQHQTCMHITILLIYDCY